MKKKHRSIDLLKTWNDKKQQQLSKTYFVNILIIYKHASDG